MKFKVGDKVAVYEGTSRRVGSVEFIRIDGMIAIDSVIKNTCVRVFNPKQCRLLIKKPRRSVRKKK